MVGADAHRRAVFLADDDQRCEFFADAFDLGRVLRVGVLHDLEFLLIRVVAGVDPHLFDDPGGDFRRIWRVMDVGDQRGDVTPCPEFLPDGFKISRLVSGWAR